LRRQSIDPADLFYAHIGAVDTVARGLLNAAAMIERGELTQIVKDRYAGWQGETGRAILDGKMTLEAVSDAAVKEGVAPQPRSGRQELIENTVGRYI
jgi:xylose isomerase